MELTARKTRTERERHKRQRYVHASHITIQTQECTAEHLQTQRMYPLIASTD